MILRQGDMFESKPDVMLVTTNAFIRNDGGLVMGRGAAFQLTQKYPEAQAEFGRLVSCWSATNPNQPYGVLTSFKWEKPVLAIFQVKNHFRDEADLGLIENSVRCLTLWAVTKPSVKFAVNFPGIGNGRLSDTAVLPLLKPLPNNVEVWTYANRL